MRSSFVSVVINEFSMFLSIIIYSITAIVLYSLARTASIRDKSFYLTTGNHLPMWSWEMVLSVLVFGFVAGARYDVGVDYLNYLEEFLNAQKPGGKVSDTFEPGFVFITEIIAHTGVHYFFYFFFWAFLQMFFIYKAFEDEKYLLPYIALWIMLGPYFLGWMNGIRQSVVSCFFVYLSRYICQKKPLPYFVGIILASTIHKSVVVLLPFYLVAYMPLKPKKIWLYYSMVIACVILGALPSWMSITSSAAQVIQLLGYETYADQFSDMIDPGAFRNTSWGPTRSGIFILDLILIGAYPKMRVFYNCSRKMDVLFVLFFIGVCLYNIFLNTSHIFLRPVEYFTVFRLPLAAYSLFYFRSTRKRFSFAFSCVIMFTYIYIIIVKSVYYPTEISETNLYKFFFL